MAELPPLLPCGCASDERNDPMFRCRTGRALEAAARLAQAFIAAAPADPFFKRLVVVTAESLSAHLRGDWHEPTPLQAGDRGEPDAGQPALRTASVLTAEMNTR
jgi:hypothetical protein